ncbi:Uncharacterized membrane protein, DUF373 family [Desulfatibacillum alkenivorans DSM 16219]|jgi:uncharacterized membrane protein (DUF373 family)|uniref:Uncharacterized membrane protein, DUF373 family n=1 Tax=Desulfatibacillum alkenivorans DSM 16219 TaxID=1121393 RepID=A0A1M6BQN4_9BACT|nr:phosphate-starvation-inducible PsiE family protein [Desulfatibacillum alkenivorans]SHI51001.1 Uncharacterized membrane protein, DUF373 family [Desulfatibacillum alkenivorans DSM 16219]
MPDNSNDSKLNHSDKFNSFCYHFNEEERTVVLLHKVILYLVRALAVLMTLVILWSVLDVVWILFNNIITPPYGILKLDDILNTFGGFLAVLIAIEIFMNIILYLREEVIHVKLVVATALMAAARKVIVFDYGNLEAAYVWATGVVIVALSISFFLVSKTEKKD